MRLKLTVGLILVTSLLLAACAPKPAPAVAPQPPASRAPAVEPAPAPAKPAVEMEWEKVVQEARKEGAVNFYATFGSPDIRAVLDKVIKEKYGIKINWIVATGSANAERIRVEQRARAYVADAFWAGPGLSPGLKAEGALATFNPIEVLRAPDVWRERGIDTYDDSRQILTAFLSIGGTLTVNTTLVRPEEYPKAYQDLLNPKWKGKIVMHDPTIAGGGSQAFTLMRKVYGREFWEKMNKQGIVFVRDYGEVTRRAAMGESAVAVGQSPVHVMPALSAGAPLKLIAPQEGSWATPHVIHIVANAPHPNAAKVLLNYMLTKEGQELITPLNGAPSVRKDVEFKAHPEVASFVKGSTKLFIVDAKLDGEFQEDVKQGAARTLFGLK